MALGGGITNKFKGLYNLTNLTYGQGISGQILLSQGPGLPATWTTATYPTTTTISQLLYSSSANTVTGLATANSSVLITNGSGVPSWGTTIPSGIAATNFTMTTPILGTPQSGNLSNCTAYPATSLTGQVALANGGTAANLTASNGGIFYSTSSAGAILSGTATANKILCSGASGAPSWSTPTFPNASATTLKYIRSDGTNWIASTSTLPDSYAQGDLLYGSASNVVSALAKSTTATRYLANTGTTNNPAWDQVNLANGVTGTLPVANGGTGNTVFPKFRAYRSGAQTINNNTATKVQFNNSSYDTNSNYDASTNYRFTPTVAGYYQIISQVIWDTVVSAAPAYELLIYKNGSAVTNNVEAGFATIASGYLAQQVSDVINMNGSTDYLEIYVYQFTGSNITIATGFSGSVYQYFTGALLP